MAAAAFFAVSAAVTVAVVMVTVLWRERVDRPMVSPLAPAPRGFDNVIENQSNGRRWFR